MRMYTEPINRYAEIPAGTTATIVTSGKTFQLGEDEIVPIRRIEQDLAFVVDDWIAVSISDIRII
jgi:hypothetical protein